MKSPELINEPSAIAGDPLTFDALHAANLKRCVDIFHGGGVEEWSPTDWACALAGEVGELCNEIEKLRRIAPTPEAVEGMAAMAYGERIYKAADELADVLIYADLLATRLGIDLPAAIVRKFNEVSDRHGSAVRLGGAR